MASALIATRVGRACVVAKAGAGRGAKAKPAAAATSAQNANATARTAHIGRREIVPVVLAGACFISCLLFGPTGSLVGAILRRGRARRHRPLGLARHDK